MPAHLRLGPKAPLSGLSHLQPQDADIACIVSLTDFQQFQRDRSYRAETWVTQLS